MICIRCNLDPTGKCSLCRTMEEIQKYANNKKLDFGGSNFLIGNNSEQEYSSVGAEKIYSMLEGLSSGGKFYSNAKNHLENSKGNYSGLEKGCSKYSLPTCVIGDYNSARNNYKGNYSEGAKNEK